jgi:hypothetical protein
VTPPANLRVYRFGAGGALDGGVVGALEQLEAGGDTELLDAVFVARDAAGGELYAIDLATGRADGTMASLLDFRLDLDRRRALTRQTLTAAAGLPASVAEAMATSLEPGGALLVALVGGTVPAALDEAVVRSGGVAIADEAVSAGSVADVAPRLRAVL